MWNNGGRGCPYVSKEFCTLIHNNLDKKLENFESRMDKQDGMIKWLLGIGISTLVGVLAALAGIIGSYIQAGG